jgi:hypothetical protein
MKWNIEVRCVKQRVVECKNIARASWKTNLLAIRRVIGPVECTTTVLEDAEGRISIPLAIKDVRMLELTSWKMLGM